MVPSYPRHPSALAQQAATVNSLAGGRLVLGVGPSHAPGIEALGLAYEKPAKHMREYVTILKTLANEGQVDFSGDMFQVKTGFMCPEAQPFDVVVSALAPLMLKAAGEVADGTVAATATQAMDERIHKRLADLEAKVAGGAQPLMPAGQHLESLSLYPSACTMIGSKLSTEPFRSSRDMANYQTIDVNSTPKELIRLAKSRS